MIRIRWYGPTLVLLATVLLVMIAGPRMVRSIVYAQDQAQIQLAAEKLANSPLLDELSRAFRQVSQVVQPSVVSIRIYSRRAAGPSLRQRQELREMLPPDMRELLPDEPQDDGGGGEFRQYDRPREVGMGSGWVYDELGHVITNNHVITIGDGVTIADRIEVTFHDGDIREATVVGSDPETDVAVLKIEGGNFHPALRAAEPVEQGDMVFAFGAPLGFTFSMSQGVVSAKDRQLNILGRRTDEGLLPGYENFLQTDAAINRGNSGGPLTNIFGQVVGMNSAIATRDRVGEGFIGLGFAIPVKMVEKVADQLIRSGSVARGWLGVEFSMLDARQAATFGYDGGAAVLVVGVLPNGPAAKAGLQKGDILLEIDGQAIDDGEKLRYMIADLTPGATVDTVVFRNGERQTLPVTLTARPGQSAVAGALRGIDPETPEAGTVILRKLGLERAAELSPSLAERLGLGADTTGVVVQAIRPGSILAEAGVAPSMVITAVMGQPIASIDALAQALSREQPGQVVRLSVVLPDGRERYIFPEIPE